MRGRKGKGNKGDGRGRRGEGMDTRMGRGIGTERGGKGMVEERMRWGRGRVEADGWDCRRRMGKDSG